MSEMYIMGSYHYHNIEYEYKLMLRRLPLLLSVRGYIPLSSCANKLFLILFTRIYNIILEFTSNLYRIYILQI